MRRRMTCGAAVLLLALLPAVAHGADHATTHRPGTGGGRIAYVGNDGNLYLVQRDSTGKRALTTDATITTAYVKPAWSPTGEGILALRFATGLQSLHSSTAGLWLVSPSGGSHQLLPNVPRGFAWTPDGRTAVYETGYFPDRTALVQLDTRTGQKRTALL